MVVKAATKKWLMENGLDQHTAHIWADGLRRNELIKLNFDETMHHLYLNSLSRIGKPTLEKETFLRDGPPKYHPFYNMGFRDVVGRDIRFDDYIDEYIQEVRNKIKPSITLPPPQYLDLIWEWGKKDKKSIAFMNYTQIPRSGK